MRTKEEDAAVISFNLKRLLADKGVTQVDLAKAIGENPTTVNMWIKGRTIPRFPKFAKIADYFGVKVSDITEKTLEDGPIEYVITDDDKCFILEYRKADAYTQEMVRRILAFSQIDKEIMEQITTPEARRERLQQLMEARKGVDT